MSAAAAVTAQRQPFNAKLVIGLVVAGLLAFAALVALLAYGDRIGPPSDGRAPVLSPAATGFKGLVQLVGRMRQTQMIEKQADLETDALVVVAIRPETRPENVRRLLELRGDRATLLILPKWVTMPDPQRRGWIRTLGPGMGERAARALGQKVTVRLIPTEARDDARGRDFLDGISAPLPESPQVIEGEDVTPLLTSRGGGALLARLGAQPHYVAADPDLFNNHGLRDAPRARAALELLEALNATQGGPIAFDLTVDGLGGSGQESRSLLRTMLEPPFLPMTLALVVAAILAGLHGAFRFGQARREERTIAFGKAALVENSAGLIRLAGRETRLGGAYADVLRHDAARLAGAPPTLQGEALDEYLNRLSKDGGPSFSELAARLYNARDRHELVAAARALFSWKKGIIR